MGNSQPTRLFSHETLDNIEYFYKCNYINKAIDLSDKLKDYIKKTSISQLITKDVDENGNSLLQKMTQCRSTESIAVSFVQKICTILPNEQAKLVSETAVLATSDKTSSTKTEDNVEKSESENTSTADASIPVVQHEYDVVSTVGKYLVHKNNCGDNIFITLLKQKRNYQFQKNTLSRLINYPKLNIDADMIRRITDLLISYSEISYCLAFIKKYEHLTSEFLVHLFKYVKQTSLLISLDALYHKRKIQLKPKLKLLNKSLHHNCFHISHQILCDDDGNLNMEFLSQINHEGLNYILKNCIRNNYVDLTMKLVQSGKFNLNSLSNYDFVLLIKHPKMNEIYKYIYFHTNCIQDMKVHDRLKLFDLFVYYKYSVIAQELIQKYPFQIKNYQLVNLIDKGFAKLVNYICQNPHLRPTDIPYETRNKLVVLNQSMKFIENNNPFNTSVQCDASR